MKKSTILRSLVIALSSFLISINSYAGGCSLGYTNFDSSQCINIDTSYLNNTAFKTYYLPLGGSLSFNVDWYCTGGTPPYAILYRNGVLTGEINYPQIVNAEGIYTITFPGLNPETEEDLSLKFRVVILYPPEVFTDNLDLKEGQASEDNSSIQEDILSDVKLFPNPVSDKLFLKTESIIPKETRIVVLDINGREVLSLPLLVNEIDVSSLSSGLYYLKLQTTKENFTQKFVKQ